MGFSRQKDWGGLPFPPSGELPDPGLKPSSPALAGELPTTEPPGKPAQGCLLTIICHPFRLNTLGGQEMYPVWSSNTSTKHKTWNTVGT